MQQQQQQQPQQMIPNLVMSSSFPPTNITTDQIQKFLDENKQLIVAIMNNQNLGKLAECAQYQALLQKNLMYLAAIADAQPQTQTPTIPSQMAPIPYPGMQQHPQAAVMAQPPPSFTPQMPTMPFNSPQANPTQMGLRPGGPTHGGSALRGGPLTNPTPSDAWRGSGGVGGGKDEDTK